MPKEKRPTLVDMCIEVLMLNNMEDAATDLCMHNSFRMVLMTIDLKFLEIEKHHKKQIDIINGEVNRLQVQVGKLKEKVSHMDNPFSSWL